MVKKNTGLSNYADYEKFLAVLDNFQKKDNNEKLFQWLKKKGLACIITAKNVRFYPSAMSREVISSHTKPPKKYHTFRKLKEGMADSKSAVIPWTLSYKTF